MAIKGLKLVTVTKPTSPGATSTDPKIKGREMVIAAIEVMKNAIVCDLTPELLTKLAVFMRERNCTTVELV